MNARTQFHQTETHMSFNLCTRGQPGNLGHMGDPQKRRTLQRLLIIEPFNLSRDKQWTYRFRQKKWDKLEDTEGRDHRCKGRFTESILLRPRVDTTTVSRGDMPRFSKPAAINLFETTPISRFWGLHLYVDAVTQASSLI